MTMRYSYIRCDGNFRVVIMEYYTEINVDETYITEKRENMTETQCAVRRMYLTHPPEYFATDNPMFSLGKAPNHVGPLE